MSSSSDARGLCSDPWATVIIPALNEAENLPQALSQLPGGLHQVILVDDHFVEVRGGPRGGGLWGGAGA